MKHSLQEERPGVAVQAIAGLFLDEGLDLHLAGQCRRLGAIPDASYDVQGHLQAPGPGFCPGIAGGDGYGRRGRAHARRAAVCCASASRASGCYAAKYVASSLLLIAAVFACSAQSLHEFFSLGA